MKIAAWTDYPIAELGDAPGKLAPVRPCEVVAYDGDKYAYVLVDGVETSFKACYIYTERGRCREVPGVPRHKLERLPLRH